MDDRYFMQTMLKQIGPEGQKKLAGASVLVIGAGGLGSPALTYLVAAGVGRVGLTDPDTVSRSNLNRQFLYGDDDIGRRKADSAMKQLSAMNGDIEIIAYEEFLSDDNAATLFAGYDLVLGAVDSFDTRFVINRTSAALCLPYIDGGVNGFCGCVMFSHPPKTPCVECVFPNKIIKKEQVGVLGATAGIIGTLEANLAVLWLLGLHNPIENKLLLYDGLRMSIDFIKIRRDNHCSVCGGSVR